MYAWLTTRVAMRCGMRAVQGHKSVLTFCEHRAAPTTPRYQDDAITKATGTKHLKSCQPASSDNERSPLKIAQNELLILIKFCLWSTVKKNHGAYYYYHYFPRAPLYAPLTSCWIIRSHKYVNESCSNVCSLYISKKNSRSPFFFSRQQF